MLFKTLKMKLLCHYIIVCLFVHSLTCLCTCVHVCLYVCMYMCVCVCMCVCPHIVQVSNLPVFIIGHIRDVG